MRQCKPNERGTKEDQQIVEAVAEAIITVLQGPEGLKKHRARRDKAQAEHKAKQGGPHVV